MEVLVHGKQLEVPERVKEYAEKRLNKLDKYLSGLASLKVVLSMERTRAATQRAVVEATLSRNGTVLRGEERAADFFTAIDAVADIMHRQILRYKAKHQKREPTHKNAIVEETLPIPEEPGRIVREKRFQMRPMTADEALDQMELLGHNFFLFYNSATKQFNVLYRRRDGDYGLIEPEVQ